MIGVALINLIIYVPWPHTGPLPHTMTDFWRMVWQEQVTLIIMLCNTVEGHRVRCQQYWPSSGSQNYGPFRIKLETEHRFADYTQRTFKIKVCAASKHNIISSSRLVAMVYPPSTRLGIHWEFCKPENFVSSG